MRVYHHLTRPPKLDILPLDVFAGPADPPIYTELANEEAREHQARWLGQPPIQQPKKRMSAIYERESLAAFYRGLAKIK
jgi:hypothetical protein